MRIKKILHQHRRDFNALFVCENCKHEQERNGCYDDRNFHDNVIPTLKCKKCNESTQSLGLEPEKTQTKYPEGFQV